MSNKGLVQASADDSKNDLTNIGINQIKEIAQSLRENVDSIYVSPHLRTRSSARVFLESRHEKLTPVVDHRLREIDYGMYVDQKDHPSMIEVANKQISGDHEARFGETGENKREILTRFYSFLIDIIDTHRLDEHIVVFSHGRAISILIDALKKAGLNALDDTDHHTDNGTVKRIEITKADRALIIHAQSQINQHEIEARKNLIKKRFRYFDAMDKNVQDLYLHNYLKIAEEGVGNIELSYEILDAITDGFYTSTISPLNRSIDPLKLNSEVVVVCALRNAETVIELFLSHYEKIGIKNFVLIDNNSSDKTLDILEKYKQSSDSAIDVWFTKERFDSFRSCGWRQRMFAYYGMDRWYLDLDVDELLIYHEVENNGINTLVSYANDNELKAVGAVMIDMYSRRPVLDVVGIHKSQIKETYSYFDTDTYYKEPNIDYGFRIYGGPRRRKFGISPWLQKFPLVYIDSTIMNTNPHFWYPFFVNKNVPFIGALMHYKFLPGDFEQYIQYAKSGVHWNNSREYKKYIEVIGNDRRFTFFDIHSSKQYKDSSSFNIINVIDRI
jgi:broad specificity phosphatase PhoE